MAIIKLNPTGSGGIFKDGQPVVQGGLKGNLHAVTTDGIIKLSYNNGADIIAGFADDFVNALDEPIEDVGAFIQENFNNASVTESELTEALDNKTIADTYNGRAVVYSDASSFSDSGVIIERNVPDDYIVYKKTGTGNQWFYSPIFVPTGENLVCVHFNVEFTRVGAHTKGLKIHVAAQPGIVAGKYFTIQELNANGEYDITFDPAYYTVYHGFEQFCIWINNQNMDNPGDSVEAKIIGLRVFEVTDAVKAVNITGDNAKELFLSTDEAITSVKNDVADAGAIKVAPNGTRYELQVDNAGDTVAIPVIPASGYFFGNSLLTGWTTFGMAASKNTKDYYYLITEYIKTLNPAFTYSKLSASSTFEAIESAGNITSVVTTLVNNLAGTENLVVVQLGDNVNNANRKAVFPQSSVALLRAIREKCPAARVVWMGMWFGDAERYTAIQNACKKTGCRFVSFADLISSNTISRIGWLAERGTATRTLNNVTNVVVNHANNITVTFTVSSTAYTTTLDVNSHSLSGGTLTYNSIYEIINSAGIAAHPGDEGFRLIANRFLFQTKISETATTYS